VIYEWSMKCSTCPAEIGSRRKFCPECKLIAARVKNVREVDKHRKKIKQLAVDYKGGCCSLCGYAKFLGALEFHHLDPAEKDFGISSKGTTASWEKIKIELNKCICLCANCHREVHAGIVSLKKG
jgi:hypothetical protein